MPPNSNPNNNISNFQPLKTGIDPVFKAAPGQQYNVPKPNVPGGAFTVLNNQEYTPNQQPTSFIPKPAPIVSQLPKSIIRTFKGDIESAVSTNHLSSINIAIAENEKMHSQIQAGAAEPVAAPASDYSLNKILIFISIILIVIGVIGVLLIFVIGTDNSSPVIQAQNLPALITTEFKDELNTSQITKDKFTTALSNKLNDSQITVNTFYNTYITSGTSTSLRLITTAEFIPLVNFTVPDIIKRTFLPDFMVGMYSFGKNFPFIILKTSSFENTFAGMLAWEKDLEGDFKIIFRLPGYSSTGGLRAELTPTTAKKFVDGVIVNKDVRMLKDTSGQIIFLYGIIDKETVVFTISDIAFKEIVNRLNKEKSLTR